MPTRRLWSLAAALIAACLQLMASPLQAVELSLSQFQYLTSLQARAKAMALAKRRVARLGALQGFTP